MVRLRLSPGDGRREVTVGQLLLDCDAPIGVPAKVIPKVTAERPDDIWPARSGFGGTEYLLSGVFSEGSRCGYSHTAEVAPGLGEGRRVAVVGRATAGGPFIHSYPQVSRIPSLPTSWG